MRAASSRVWGSIAASSANTLAEGMAERSAMIRSLIAREAAPTGRGSFFSLAGNAVVMWEILVGGTDKDGRYLGGIVHDFLTK